MSNAWHRAVRIPRRAARVPRRALRVPRRAAARLILVALALVAAALSGLAACAGSGPPPSAHAELRPVKPHPRAVWVPGHWEWSGRKAGYRWVEGHWKIP